MKRKLLSKFFALVCVSGLFWGSSPDVFRTLAEPHAVPSSQPGFPLPLDAQRAGIPGSDPRFAGVALADLDLDGTQEIVVGGREVSANLLTYACGGVVYAIRSNGTLLWSTRVRGDIQSTPAIADLTGDGYPDVVVGMGALTVDGETLGSECGRGNYTARGNGGLAALNGRTGALLWEFDTADRAEWGSDPNPATLWINGENGVRDGVFSSPAIAKLRASDAHPHIAVGGWDNCIYLLDHLGRSVWGILPFNYSHPRYVNTTAYKSCNERGFFAHDTVWSSPTFADVDLDGVQDIVIGGDATHPNVYGLRNGGVLWVLSSAGVVMAQHAIEQTVHSSPAVADLDLDGVAEIIVGTGDAYCENQTPGGLSVGLVAGRCQPATALAGRFVSALNFVPAGTTPTERLALRWRTALSGPPFASPAIGDLNQDGILDVVIQARYDAPGQPPTVGPGPTAGSYVHALNGSTGTPISGFPVHLCEHTNKSFPTRNSPILGNITGDARPEIIIPMGRQVSVILPNGQYYSAVNTLANSPACHGVPYNGGTTNQTFGEGARVQGANTDVSGAMYGTAAVGDLDGDGDSEIVAVGTAYEDADQKHGVVYAWSGFQSGPHPWPMFRRSADHIAVVPFAGFTLVPTTERISFSASLQDMPAELNTVIQVRSNLSDTYGLSLSTQSARVLLPFQQKQSSGLTTIPIVVSLGGLQPGRYTYAVQIIAQQSLPVLQRQRTYALDVHVYAGPIRRSYLSQVMR